VLQKAAEAAAKSHATKPRKHKLLTKYSSLLQKIQRSTITNTFSFVLPFPLSFGSRKHPRKVDALGTIPGNLSDNASIFLIQKFFQNQTCQIT